MNLEETNWGVKETKIQCYRCGRPTTAMLDTRDDPKRVRKFCYVCRDTHRIYAEPQAAPSFHNGHTMSDWR